MVLVDRKPSQVHPDPGAAFMVDSYFIAFSIFYSFIGTVSRTCPCVARTSWGGTAQST